VPLIVDISIPNAIVDRDRLEDDRVAVRCLKRPKSRLHDSLDLHEGEATAEDPAIGRRGPTFGPKVGKFHGLRDDLAGGDVPPKGIIVLPAWNRLRCTDRSHDVAGVTPAAAAPPPRESVDITRTEALRQRKKLAVAPRENPHPRGFIEIGDAMHRVILKNPRHHERPVPRLRNHGVDTVAVDPALRRVSATLRVAGASDRAALIDALGNRLAERQRKQHDALFEAPTNGFSGPGITPTRAADSDTAVIHRVQQR
jgi:hypothetical protein